MDSTGEICKNSQLLRELEELVNVLRSPEELQQISYQAKFVGVHMKIKTDVFQTFIPSLKVFTRVH